MFTLRTYTTKALPKLQYREWPTPQPRRKPENCYTLGLATTPFQTGTQKVVLRDHELAASWSRPKEGGSQLVGAAGGHTLGWAMASNCPPCGPAPMGEGSGGNGYSHPKGRSPGQSAGVEYLLGKGRLGSHYAKQCAAGAPGSPPVAASSVRMAAVSSQPLAPLWGRSRKRPADWPDLPRDQACAPHTLRR